MSVSVAPLPSGSFLSLPGLLDNCVVACIAAQQYVQQHFLQGGESSAGVIEKGALAHKQGVTDVVTQADLAVQDVLVSVLRCPEYTKRATFRLTSADAPPPHAGLRVVLVGEEAEDGVASLSRAQRATRAATAATAATRGKYAAFLQAAEASPLHAVARNSVLSPALRRRVERAQACLDSATPQAPVAPAGTNGWWLEQALSGGGDGSGSASSESQAVPEYTVYVDPIDATLAFVAGDRRAPMTLVGIARNGVPVAGVAMRVFPQEAGSPTADKAAVPDANCLSLCVVGGPSLLWGLPIHAAAAPLPPVDNAAVRASSATDARSDWRFDATFSDTTTAAKHARMMSALAPYSPRPARGGGNKCFLVAARAAALNGGAPAAFRTALAESGDVGVDAYPSAGGLKAWDYLAPHAFLRSFGGDALSLLPADPTKTNAEGGEFSGMAHSLRYTLPPSARRYLDADGAPPPAEADFSMTKGRSCGLAVANGAARDAVLRRWLTAPPAPATAPPSPKL